MDILVKIIQFFLCFTILIGIHEMGHFIMARVFKIRVEKFYIFFDPWFSLFKFKRGNTEYGLGWLPLGGYVKIAGMIDESMDTEQMKQPVKQDEFRAKPAWQRFLVMIAGVVMNVVLAVAIYIGICYTWGDTYFSNADAKWGYNFNEAGHKLGFHDGDRLVSIDGEEADDINKVVNSLIITESDRSVVVERNGRQVELILPLDELISMRQQKGYENFLLPRIQSNNTSAFRGLRKTTVIFHYETDKVRNRNFLFAAISHNRKSHLQYRFSFEFLRSDHPNNACFLSPLSTVVIYPRIYIFPVRRQYPFLFVPVLFFFDKICFFLFFFATIPLQFSIPPRLKE